MKKEDFFESVYFIDGKYFDPYEVLKIAKSVSENEKEALILELKERGFTSNKNIREFVNKFEYSKSISS